MNHMLAIYGAGLAAVAALPKIKRRLELSVAKHPSLAGHSRMAKRVARLLPFYEYDESRFFSCDNAPADVVARRKAGFTALRDLYGARYPASVAQTAEASQYISDLQFTAHYRVPFQFSRLVRENLKGGSFLQASEGVKVTDLDGNVFYDLTGSYGVNVFGYDFYRQCIAEGSQRVTDLGPVLGAYHPLVAANARRLAKISGLDEVSFHMSGTEAVMQAVRLARYHTGRKNVVRFCGAYHGWWEDVQPGIGNPLPPRETYTLRDMDARALRVLATRKDIACVLVNPLQALHPNRAAPGDSSLLDGSRRAGYDREAYTRWLHELRETCTANGIVLILDEVFVGFRLAARGAQEYFGIQADMVTYGKTLGGGLPVGVVCGKQALMRRFRDNKPADICFARGTFNSHPYVMGAMASFLDRMETPEVARLYENQDARWDARREAFNEALAGAGFPVRLDNLSSIWTVSYTRPSRYHWMFQYYLRAEGLALSWVGTGRLIFSLNYSDADFEAVKGAFLRAAAAMDRDGWWWNDGSLTQAVIRKSLLRETVARFFRRGS